MMRDVLDFLIEGLVASSVAVVLVLLLRRHWSRWFGATQLRLLWLLAPAAMLAVALPARVQTVVAEPAQAIEFATRTAAGQVPLVAASDNLLQLALWVWLVGCVLSMGYFGHLQRRFQKRLGRVLDRGDGVCVAESAQVGPAVLGLLRPRIILPADFEQRFDHEQQALILTHERSHLRGGDIIANGIATLLRSLYWFNPLIHYAAARMRHDHELASDADVLRTHPHARRRYADTLLNEQLAVPGLPVGCLWQSSHPLKERIIMLKQPVHTRVKTAAGLTVGLSLSLTVSALAWAAQPARLAVQESAPQPASASVTAGRTDSETSYRSLRPPSYPKAAIDASQAGRLVLTVDVSPSGEPLEVIVAETTHPGVFDEAAIAAVKQWTFNPAIRNGQPIASRVQVPVCFDLDASQSSCPGPDAALDGIYIRAPQATPAG